MAGVYNLKGKQYVKPRKAQEYLNCTNTVLGIFIKKGMLKTYIHRNIQFVDLDSIETMLRNRQQPTN